MPDTLAPAVLEHFHAAHLELDTQIAAADLREIEIRNELDTVIGERTRLQALRAGLEQLLTAHTPDQPPPAPVQVTRDPHAKPAPATKAAAAARRPTGTSPEREAEFQAVAATARKAHAEGRSMTTAVAETHHRTPAAASTLLSTLRSRGYDIPRARAAAPGEPTIAEPSLTFVGTATREATAVAGTNTAKPRTAPIRTAKPAGSGIDLHEVARVVLEADKAGLPPIPALVAHFKKPESTVKNWLKKVRDTGMVPRSPRPNLRVVDDTPTPPSTPVACHNLQEVADTFREAVEVGRKPIQTIIDRYDVDRPTATEWVGLCRAAGLLPPKGEPVVTTEAPMQFVSRT